jgi:isoquinoline 1-oxidoreductase alpha subunit
MVPQCGYCIPGMIMAAAALIDRNDSPTDEQIDAALTNICRCGVYPRLREALRLAARIKTGRATVEGAPPPNVSAEDAARSVPALRAEPRRRTRR